VHYGVAYCYVWCLHQAAGPNELVEHIRNTITPAAAVVQEVIQNKEAVRAQIKAEDGYRLVLQTLDRGPTTHTLAQLGYGKQAPPSHYLVVGTLDLWFKLVEAVAAIQAAAILAAVAANREGVNLGVKFPEEVVLEVASLEGVVLEVAYLEGVVLEVVSLEEVILEVVNREAVISETRVVSMTYIICQGEHMVHLVILRAHLVKQEALLVSHPVLLVRDGVAQVSHQAHQGVHLDNLGVHLVNLQGEDHQAHQAIQVVHLGSLGVHLATLLGEAHQARLGVHLASLPGEDHHIHQEHQANQEVQLDSLGVHLVTLLEEDHQDHPLNQEAHLAHVILIQQLLCPH